jgi:hypothetical protein
MIALEVINIRLMLIHDLDRVFSRDKERAVRRYRADVQKTHNIAPILLAQLSNAIATQLGLHFPMDQVALAMQNIAQASAQNVATTMPIESAAQNLHELGQKLKLLVEQDTVKHTRHSINDVTPERACPGDS